MRAVLDPNVLVSALLSPAGPPARLLSRWLAGAFELIVSEALLDEVERVLAYPKLADRVSREEAVGYVSRLRRRARLAADPPTPQPRSSDPDDDYLLALAEAERAILVSGDQHLLSLAGRWPVMSPREFADGLDT